MLDASDEFHPVSGSTMRSGRTPRLSREGAGNAASAPTAGAATGTAGLPAPASSADAGGTFTDIRAAATLKLGGWRPRSTWQNHPKSKCG